MRDCYKLWDLLMPQAASLKLQAPSLKLKRDSLLACGLWLLFVFQRFSRLGRCSFNGLVANGKQRDQ